jgi:hypothetical protein
VASSWRAAGPAEFRVGIGVELTLPLAEEIAGNRLHRVDAVGHRLRARLAAFQFRLQAVVGLLQAAGLDLHHRLEALQRVDELLASLLLRGLRVVDAGDHDVALLDAELLLHAVDGGAAAGQREQQLQGQQGGGGARKATDHGDS